MYWLLLSILYIGCCLYAGVLDTVIHDIDRFIADTDTCLWSLIMSITVFGMLVLLGVIYRAFVSGYENILHIIH